MSHIIKLEKFEGPLDALLKIIEGQELDISEVSLAEVTDQYLNYIDQTDIDPTEIADFLTVAAKLLLIKSRILLPFTDELEDDDAIDLAQQLRRYQQYVDVAKKLEKLWNASARMYERPKLVVPLQKDEFVPPNNLDNNTLLESCLQVLAKIKPIIKLPEKTIQKVISLKEKIEHLSERLKEQAEFYFHEALDRQDDISEKIVSFLAMLELVKQREVVVVQSETFADIIVKKV